MNIAETTTVHTAGTPAFVIVLAIITWALAIIATIRCVWVGNKGVLLVLWLLLIWLAPIVGPLLALWLARRAAPQSLH